MKLLTKEEVTEITSIKFEDIGASLLKSFFSRTLKQPNIRFNVTDYFMLPENTCSNNLAGFTTIGLYFFNKLVTDKFFKDVTGYINVPITGGNIKKMYSLISQALFNDKVTWEEFYFLIDMLEWLAGGDLAELLNISLTNRLYILPPEIKARREELFKKYAKEIEAGDVYVGSLIETELVGMARKYLEKFPEWDNFASDAKLNFDNNYKTVMIMKGPILDTGTNSWKIATSNYDDGIKKEEYPLFADSAVSGTYARAIGVAQGGYQVKKFIASLQDVETADLGSDCGTTEYLETILDPFFKETYLDMYIIEGTKLVQLTSENITKYLGKPIKLRSPMFCKYPSPRLCNKCVGEHPYKMNLKTIGLASTKIGSTLMNKRLKAFHNKQVHIYEMEVEDLFL
jgi:hypothetical protein